VIIAGFFKGSIAVDLRNVSWSDDKGIVVQHIDVCE